MNYYNTFSSSSFDISGDMVGFQAVACFSSLAMDVVLRLTCR